jgi:hypothetical protein
MIKIKVVSALSEGETVGEKKVRLARNQHQTGRKQYPSDDPSHMSRTDRLQAVFPGYEDQRKLAKGIAEKKKPISPKTGEREGCLPGNKSHRGSDGRFTDGTDSGGSWSIAADEKYRSKERRTGCDRGQMRRSGKSKKWTKVPCGRRGRKSIGGKKPTYIRCHDGKKVVPGKKRQVDESSVKVPIDQHQEVNVDALIRSLRAKQDRITALERALRQVRKNGCKRQMSVEQLAVAVDAVQRATKGKLREPEKSKV